MFITPITQRRITKNGRTYSDFRRLGERDACCKVTDSDGKVRTLSVWWTAGLRTCVVAQEYVPGGHFGKHVNYAGIPVDVRRSLKEAIRAHIN